MEIARQQIRKILEEILPESVLSTFSDELKFKDQDVDSLDVVTLLLALEERHGLVVPDSDVQKCSSVDEIISYARGREI